MKRNYKRMALSAGMALVLASTPITAMAGTLRNGHSKISNISTTSANSITSVISTTSTTSVISNISTISANSTAAANSSLINTKVDVSAFNGNTKVNGSKITIDGKTSDWKDIKERESKTDKIDSWKVAIASDYSELYICYEGTASTQWDYNFMGANDEMVRVHMDYHDGTQNEKSNISFTAWDGYKVKNGWNGDIAGSDIAVVNEAHLNTPAPYVVEAVIPMEFFADSDFTLTFAGTTVDIRDVEVLRGDVKKEDTKEDSKEDKKDDTNDETKKDDTKDETKEDDKEAVYKGITIDGRFSDWDAVTKYDVGCPNPDHKDCIEKTAMVFDGDYVYIYIKDGETSSAYGAGSHSNGMYTIKSDMGNEMVFQLTQDGDINGVDKAECKHVGKQWEIAIPKSELPTYNNTISFGLYLTEPFIENVSNLDESKGVEISTDITYDGLKGLYGDWDRYPHTTIEYATAGTHYQIVDSKGALYCDGGSTLLGHVVTTMPNHVDKEKDAGGEFMSAVTIKFNNNEKQVFSPRLVSVDEAGNINWNTPNGGYEDGTYEFYIFSTHDAWNNAGNIYEDSINRENSEWYGKMTITVKNGVQDECEFYLDLEKVAKKFGCDASDFKRIDAQFGRLGQQWITTAGASSGAWLGLILCVGVTAGVLVYQKKKGNRQVS